MGLKLFLGGDGIASSVGARGRIPDAGAGGREEGAYYQ